MISEIFELIDSKLPHGSGFNCDYNFSVLNNGVIKCASAFACTSEGGFTDGYVCFYVLIDLRAEDFVLKFTGPESHALNRKYQLRGYMTDTIAEALDL